MTLPGVPAEVILLVKAEVTVITVTPEAVPETGNRILVKPVPIVLVVIPEQIMQVETMAAEIQGRAEPGRWQQFNWFE